MVKAGGESTFTVLVAFGANFAIAAAKTAAALIGIVLAAAGIAMHELTDAAAWDANGSILVGVLLGVVAVLLIDRNRRFLTGEPGSADLREAAIARVQQLPDVASVRYLRLEFIGPKQLFLVASVDLTGDDAESSVARRLRRLERNSRPTGTWSMPC